MSPAASPTSRSRSAATNRCAQAIHVVFLYHAIRAGMDMGIVNAGALPLYDDLDADLRERVEDVVLNRRRGRAPSACSRSPNATRARRARSAVEDLAWRDAPVRERLTHALVHGIDQYIEADTEEARAAVDAPAGRDRRPADGRHERGRRPVRRRQDVPAAGGEVGARDEEGRRLPAALHRGREAAHRRRRQVQRQDRAWPRSRATCTTSARTSSAWCWPATTSR